MQEDAKKKRMGSLAGTERAFFEGRKAELRAGYEAGVQQELDAWEASLGVVAALGRKRFRKVSFATCFGKVVLRCREGIGGDGRWTCPALAHLGLRPNQRYSPDLERRMAVLSAETGSYEKASGVADAAAWLAASDGAMRSAVMRLGAIAAAAPPEGRCAGAAGPNDTLVIMADGWNARHRGENWGRDKDNRKLPERVHWHEIRSAVLFRLSALLAVSGKRKALMEKHAVAVPANTSPHDFGVLLHREALRMGLAQAQAVFFVMDGGAWLWNVFQDRFEKCSKAMLDFYYLSQHLHALAAALHGAGTAKAQAWCGKILHDLKHRSPKRLFKTLDELLRPPPLRRPGVLGVHPRAERLFQEPRRSYGVRCLKPKCERFWTLPANAALGVPIGSGSVESLCPQLQNRRKRTGQFWTQAGFAALLRIIVRSWNGELDSLWQTAAA